MMQFKKEKFKALVHFICRECRDYSKLGKTKLHKILWLSDVQNYQWRTEPLTGEKYIKMRFGPCADHLDMILDELQKEGRMNVHRFEFDGFDKYEFHARGEPDLSYFTDKELNTIKANIKNVSEDHTASSISDKSHDKIWQIASLREEIPYNAYLVKRLQKPTSDDIAWAQSEIARL